LAERYKTPRQTKVRPEAYAPVIEGMRKAVEHGTAYNINTADYQICGKTGTAETAGPDHSLFIGFAPMKNPQIAIAVCVEHGGFGADMAAPMAALIMEQYLNGKLKKTSEQKAKRIASKTINP
jgi:penicillin-binding protein 2